MCHFHHAAYRGHASRGGFRPFFARHFQGPAASGYAPVNIIQKSDLYELELFAPGKSRADFDVKVKGNELSIRYENQPEGEGRQWVRQEFGGSSFERVFSLDDSIDTELITARYENGVLIVLLPIKPESRRPAQQVPVG